MARDPATLWYWNDWHSGTVTFTRHLKGCYMDLLHAQFNNGRLSMDAIKTVLGNDFAMWGALSKKFVRDTDGLYYNERAELEQQKRKTFSDSRKNNLAGNKKPPHVAHHMDNRDEIDIWNNGFEFLKEDEVWFTEVILMKTKLHLLELDNCLEQFWLSLRKANFKGELKQIRSGFEKWHNTWQAKKQETGTNKKGNNKQTAMDIINIAQGAADGISDSE